MFARSLLRLRAPPAALARPSAALPAFAPRLRSPSLARSYADQPDPQAAAADLLGSENVRRFQQDPRVVKTTRRLQTFLASKGAWPGRARPELQVAR